MTSDSLEYQPVSPDVSIYECEVHLKFRLIEENGALSDREELLEKLLDAFTFGSDEYLENLQILTKVQKIAEMQASPKMRRQLIRLRNLKE
ncbi:MAG: Npun_R1517 family heterocyst differentiation transcriptional regulator [Leptolyngbyaceae bacterium]|nr:Npun_R1517 family heterocyst differentiation transcriptional regulator [Leptolyngbyaceae bacterium]